MGENNFRVCEEVQHNRVFVAEGRRGGKKRKYICDLISDPDVGEAFKYYAQYPGVMQGSQAENVLSYGARVPISEQTYS